jgi:hypothetical protein
MKCALVILMPTDNYGHEQNLIQYKSAGLLEARDKLRVSCSVVNRECKAAACMVQDLGRETNMFFYAVNNITYPSPHYLREL